MKDRLVIIGSGGHAKVVAEAVAFQGAYELVGFVDRRTDSAESLMGYEIRSDLDNFEADHFIVAIGDNKVRQQKFEEAISANLIPSTLVHPSAIVSPTAEIEHGSLVCAGA